MPRLIDITTPTDPVEVPARLQLLANRCDALARRIRDSLALTDRTVALANFSLYIAGELRHVASFYPGDVAGMAWAARNLFEVNLIVRHVLDSEDNFRLWLGQLLHDEKDFIEGVLAQSEPSDNADAKHALASRLSTLSDLAARHELPFSKPFRSKELAECLGELDEYTALFKLFSKYVHPSSLYINAYARTDPDDAWLDIFLVKSQVYAGETIERISKDLGITDS